MVIFKAVLMPWSLCCFCAVGLCLCVLQWVSVCLDGFVGLVEDIEAWQSVTLRHCFTTCHHSLQVYSPVEMLVRTCYTPFMPYETLTFGLTICMPVAVYHEICVTVLLQYSKAHKSGSSSHGLLEDLLWSVWERKAGEREQGVGGSEIKRKWRSVNELERTKDWKGVGGGKEEMGDGKREMNTKENDRNKHIGNSVVWRARSLLHGLSLSVYLYQSVHPWGESSSSS